MRKGKIPTIISGPLPECMVGSYINLGQSFEMMMVRYYYYR